MYWTKVTIKTKSESVDLLTSLLIDEGISGFEIEDKASIKQFIENNESHWDYVDEKLLNNMEKDAYVKFYISRDDFGKEQLKNIKKLLYRVKSEDTMDLGDLLLKTEKVNDEDWKNNWKEHYKPFKIGDRIVIKPMWEDYKATSDEIVFNINPGNIFGTGLHESTKMSAVFLEKYMEKDFVVADLGCGSGILSIISLLLGGKEAYACDIDSAAYEAAYENAELNDIDSKNYHVKIGDIINDNEMVKYFADRKYDIIVANIVADVIIDLGDIVPDMLNESGLFITSGIIKERRDDVVDSLKSKGFELIDEINMGSWTSGVYTYRGKI